MESGTGGEDSGERAQRSNFGRLVAEKLVEGCHGKSNVLWDNHWLHLWVFPHFMPVTSTPGGGEGNRPLLPQRRLQELAAEVDPHQLLDEDVEEVRGESRPCTVAGRRTRCRVIVTSSVLS